LPVSRLVFGCDNQENLPWAMAGFDDFFERGGNAFDTAYVYGGGKFEQFLGKWIKLRDIRSQVVLTVKGAHTPFCTPEFLDKQLRESLDRLQTDYADIYLMHRDNLRFPAGEFVEMLNEHHRAGRIKTFGGSNWTLTRLQEAEAYATKNGLRKFNCLSNQFSLARMVTPIWDGGISANDPAFKEWMAGSNISLLAWSSQARGFFSPRGHSDEKNEELLRCWNSDDNFLRRERASELARQKGVPTINIALAYVLCQPFQTFALIGPRQISQTVDACRALSVTLTPEEINWLNLVKEIL